MAQPLHVCVLPVWKFHLRADNKMDRRDWIEAAWVPCSLVSDVAFACRLCTDLVALASSCACFTSTEVLLTDDHGMDFQSKNMKTVQEK